MKACELEPGAELLDTRNDKRMILIDVPTGGPLSAYLRKDLHSTAVSWNTRNLRRFLERNLTVRLSTEYRNSVVVENELVT